MKVFTSSVHKDATIKVLESTNNVVANSARVMDIIETHNLFPAIIADDFHAERIKFSFTDLDHEHTELYIDSKEMTRLLRLLVDYSYTIAREFVDE